MRDRPLSTQGPCPAQLGRASPSRAKTASPCTLPSASCFGSQRFVTDPEGCGTVILATAPAVTGGRSLRAKMEKYNPAFDKSKVVLEMMTTASQLRAARALVQLSQGELAKRIGMSVPTIAAAEQGRNVFASTIAAIQGALEAAGVTFSPDGGVKLAPPRAEFIERDPDNPTDRATRAAAARFLNLRRKMKGLPLLPEDD